VKRKRRKRRKNEKGERRLGEFLLSPSSFFYFVCVCGVVVVG